MIKLAYVDANFNNIWPSTVLCEEHATKESLDEAMQLMVGTNTTASLRRFPAEMLPYDCIKCPKS